MGSITIGTGPNAVTYDSMEAALADGWGRGGGATWDRYTGAQGTTGQKEQDTTQPRPAAEAIHKFAQKWGMTDEAAAKTIEEYGRIPEAARFKNLPPGARKDLEQFGRIPGGWSQEVYYSARDKFKDYMEGDKLSIDKALESGLTNASDYRAAGYKITQNELNRMQTQLKLASETNLNFERNNIIIGNLAMPVKDFNALPDKYRSIAVREGYEAMKEAIVKDETAYKEFQSKNVVINGKTMSVADFNSLPEKYRSKAINQGFDAMEAAIEADQEAQQDAIKRLEVARAVEKVSVGKWISIDGTRAISQAEYNKLSGQQQDMYVKNVSMQGPVSTKDVKLDIYDYDKLAAFIKDNKDGEKIIREAGFENPEALIKELKAINKETEDMTITRYTDGKKVITEAEYKALGDSVERDRYRLSLDTGRGAKIKGGVQIAADIVVPVYGTARHWGEMNEGERAFSMLIDVVSFTLIAKAATMGARSSFALTRTGAMKGATIGAGQEMLNQLAGPVTLVAHPVASAKAAGRNVADIIETLVHPNQIPEIVASTSHNTVRLPVSLFKSEASAMAARDELMKLAKAGYKITVEADGMVIDVARSPLMKELGGGLAHASPMGEKFAEGLVVDYKPGLSEAEQGLFMSHEPLGRFAEATARGVSGEKAVFFIVSKETAEEAVSSGKVYKSPKGKVVELESVFKLQTKLDPPKQKLFTRIGPEAERVEIWLEKPLSQMQIAKLKAKGIIETLKSPFRPAAKITGIMGKELTTLEKALEASGNTSEARALRRAYDIAGSRRATLATLGRSRSVRRAEVEAVRRNIERYINDRTTRVYARNVAPGRALTAYELARVEREKQRYPTGRSVRASAIGRSDRITIDGRISREAERVDTGEGRVTTGETERITIDRATGRTGRTTIGETKEKTTIPKPGASDKEIREYTESADGIIGWRQGERFGKDVWHVMVYPYEDDSQLFTLVGEMPKGNVIYARGEGSAKKTVGVFRGKKPKKTINIDMGIQDVSIIPTGDGVEIGFKSDSRQQTKLEFDVSKRSRLTERARLPRESKQLNGRGRARITPRRGRLPK